MERDDRPDDRRIVSVSCTKCPHRVTWPSLMMAAGVLIMFAIGTHYMAFMVGKGMGQTERCITDHDLDHLYGSGKKVKHGEVRDGVVKKGP